MSRLIIEEPPLQVLPSLAVAVGLNEAIVLQQVHYWLQQSKNLIAGQLWVYNSVRQWRQQFPFWSDDTIARALKSLRTRGVLIAEALSDDPRDRSLYYRINYQCLSSLSSGRSGAECIAASCGNGDQQLAAMDTGNLRQSHIWTETTTEKTQRRAPKAPAATPTGFAEFWDVWPNTARKANKKGCLNIWTRNKLEGKAYEIIKHIEAMKQSKPWEEGFEPAPMTYLNQERWADGVKVDAEQDELRALFARAE